MSAKICLVMGLALLSGFCFRSAIESVYWHQDSSAAGGGFFGATMLAAAVAIATLLKEPS